MDKFFIKTFGCVQNKADTERIRTLFWERGYEEVDDWRKADLVIINSCVVRESAENRVYGLINEIRKSGLKPKIILTGCLAGILGKRKITGVDEIIKMGEIGFEIKPLRDKKGAALIPISNGCDNFCSYCIVPYSRGREVSRPMGEILKEVDRVTKEGFKEVVLIGQNVNSYGKGLFPVLLGKVAKKKLGKISFISSNPWDFSNELVEVIAKHKNIDRLIHLPLQSGDDEILKKMNRGYTAKAYLDLIKKIKRKIKEVRFSTDIIIGFPGEDEKAFKNTVKVCKRVGFEIAYLNKYSPRAGTVSAKLYKDDVKVQTKKRRWKILNDLINRKSV